MCFNIHPYSISYSSKIKLTRNEGSFLAWVLTTSLKILNILYSDSLCIQEAQTNQSSNDENCIWWFNLDQALLFP